MWYVQLFLGSVNQQGGAALSRIAGCRFRSCQTPCWTDRSDVRVDMKSQWDKWLNFIKDQSGTPDQIAGGVAIGCFFGLFLPPGTQIFAALAVATYLGCNRILAICTTWITNPFTMPVIYTFYIILGSKLTGTPFPEYIPNNLEELWNWMFVDRYPGMIFYQFVSGAFLISIITTYISYYLVKRLVLKLQGDVKVQQPANALE